MDPLPEPPPAETAPPVVPDHELLRRIGAGAYGEVWLARTVLGELRAVKIIRRDAFGGDPRPFEREFEGIRRFEPISRSDPSQIAILHVGRAADDSYFYYVMELGDACESQKEEGRIQKAGDEPLAVSASSFCLLPSALVAYAPRTLRSDLRDGARLPVARVVDLGRALTQALAHLHRQGLVHRDVKPSNIIFVGGRPKLADIGLVTQAAAGDDARSIVGTEGYLAPEGPGTPQADLYALGKVLYEAAMGRDRRDFPDLPHGWPDVPEREALLELNEVIVKACASDGRERYQSADQMRADLELLHADHSVKRRQAWRRRGAMICKLALFAAIAGLAVWMTRRFSVTKSASSPIEQARTSGTVSIEAFNYFQAGNVHSYNTKPEGFANAIANYEKSVAIDPKYARAWAELAERYLLMETYGGNLPSTNALKGRDAAIKAIALDPTLARGHVALALYLVDYEWDWTGAEKELRLALKLDSRSASVHQRLAMCLVTRGIIGVDVAVEELRRAVALEPMDAVSNGNLAGMLYLSRRYREAVEMMEKSLAMDPEGAMGWEGLADMRFDEGKNDQAVAAWLKALALKGESKTLIAALQTAYDRGGIETFLKGRLEVLTAQSGKNARAVMDAAIVCSRLGNRDEAFRWLNEAVARRSHWIKFLKVHPGFDPIRSDPRFTELLKRVGLEK